MPEAFWEHAPLHTAAEVLARPSPIPARPGVYGWFFREIPTGVDPAGTFERDGLRLLYVGISPKAPPDFRSRAAETLSHFMAVLLVAVLLGIPDQRRWEFGVELLVLAAVLGGGLFWLDRVASASPSTQPISRALAVLSPRTITTVLLAVTGLLLVVGVDDGIYVVVPAVIAAMTGGVASAWLFLTKITG